MSSLTIKPGKAYLLIAAMFPLLAIGFYWGFGQAEPSGDPVAAQIAIVVFCLLWALPGVIVALFYKLTRLTVDDAGMVSARLLRPTVRCTWDEVTGAELKEEALAFPCVIRANGRRIAKITRAFDGYDQLLDLLTERGMLREDDLMGAAKTWVALDRMKVSDLFGRKK